MSKISINPWPSFTQEEVNAVQRVLLSRKVNYWTGQEGREFEKEFAKFADSEYAIAVSNGTTALDLALRGLGIGEGDEVIVTSRTFIASVSSIVTVGAVPVFADVNRDSQNISPDTIAEVISSKTKAIICVHLAGWPVDLDGVMALADMHDLKVIEDCAQAHGAKYKSKSVGSIGHVGAWSFCQDKIMSTGGEGGMVTTSSRELWSRMWSFKDHGKSYDAMYNRAHPFGFRWVHESFGTNYRLTEMQSAIGRIQLARMPQWNAQRTQNAHILGEVCRRFDFLRVPELPSHIRHAYYKFYVFVEREKLPKGVTRNKLVAKISEAGIPCMQGSCSEVYLEKAFDNHPSRPKERLPVAKELGETSMMFLVHPTIDAVTMSRIANDLEVLFSNLARGV